MLTAWEGRKLLADTVGTELSAADLETLRGYRDQALGAGEMAPLEQSFTTSMILQDINNEVGLGDLSRLV